MENTNIENGVVAEGVTTPNEQPFRAFKTQEEFDNFSARLVKKGKEQALKNAKIEDDGVTFNKKEYEAKFRKDLEASITAELERKAKLSEVEKLSEEREQMEKSFREERIEINKDKARVLLQQSGFEEEDMDVYLDFVTEDRDISLGKIRRVCEAFKTRQEKLKAKWQADLQKTNPNVMIGNNQNITQEQAMNMTLAERIKLKNENYPLYQSLFKK